MQKDICTNGTPQDRLPAQSNLHTEFLSEIVKKYNSCKSNSTAVREVPIQQLKSTTWLVGKYYVKNGDRRIGGKYRSAPVLKSFDSKEQAVAEVMRMESQTLSVR